MNTASTLASQNIDWGFFGTMGDDAEAAWPLAMAAITEATGEDDETVRSFLDSKSGRHFADDVLSGLHFGLALPQAIGGAIERWMGWTITRYTAKSHGIPVGLPYLIGFVIHEGMMAELA